MNTRHMLQLYRHLHHLKALGQDDKFWMGDWFRKNRKGLLESPLVEADVRALLDANDQHHCGCLAAHAVAVSMLDGGSQSIKVAGKVWLGLAALEADWLFGGYWSAKSIDLITLQDAIDYVGECIAAGELVRSGEWIDAKIRTFNAEYQATFA